MLVVLIVTEVAPSIFQQRRLRAQENLLRSARKAQPSPVAYLIQDRCRDEEAMVFNCYSSRRPLPGYPHPSYDIWFGFDMLAYCTCPDFQERGGACKHMRAALLQLKAWQVWLAERDDTHPLLGVPECHSTTIKSPQ